MSKVKVELNRAGVRELLRSPEMAAGLSELAAGIAGRCGDGYGSDTKMMPTRVIASVYPETLAAVRDNSQNNTILRSLQ